MLLTTASSSQHAAQVQEVACGCRIPSSIKHCSVLPPYRMLLFQSLLLALPANASNSLGVYHTPSILLIHFPRPPVQNTKMITSVIFHFKRLKEKNICMPVHTVNSNKPNIIKIISTHKKKKKKKKA